MVTVIDTCNIKDKKKKWLTKATNFKDETHCKVCYPSLFFNFVSVRISLFSNFKKVFNPYS